MYLLNSNRIGTTQVYQECSGLLLARVLANLSLELLRLSDFYEAIRIGATQVDQECSLTTTARVLANLSLELLGLSDFYEIESANKLITPTQLDSS
ncbi:hypothetical protein CDAR_216191 [Caerostris darwini]|uniref:Uncharacterized protein n=1 Tax=Caerostris darwini TaxID=1538125 RepID=A0AAV4SKP1_9ARAC|nr:hypothetical protein CDAR_216191 [Caerostris darwini]